METVTHAALEAATDGRYEIESLIGRGGMGMVFLARHRELGSHVAIKVLPPEIAENPDLLARFKREAALTARLSHPNIVPVFAFDVRDSLAYLVMPYVDGVTLETLLRERGKLERDEVLKLLREVGSAIGFAHARGIVHRDIKPANLLLETETGRWLVADFGIAHVASAEDTVLTQTGAAIGTPAYMAPEQMGSAADVDGRADLYALAAVAFEALCGQRPTPQQSAGSLAKELHELRSDITSAVTRVLTAPLALARDDRPDSVENWLELLGHGHRGIKLRVALSIAAAAVIAVVGLVMLRPAPGPISSQQTVAVFPFSVSGEAQGIDLDSVLPDAFVWQLQTLPEHQVIPAPTVRTAIVSRYGNRVLPRDTLLALASRLQATHALLGQAGVTGSALSIRVEVYDVRSQRLLSGAEISGPPDSLHALVGGLVIETFAVNVARERSGAPAPSLPTGLPAISAYFQGDRAFRRGAYPEAMENFDRVIELDSTYAPAHFKRMLATILWVRPTRTAGEIRAALDASQRYRSRLDPVSGRMLEGYDLLLRQGDINAAQEAYRRIVDEHPDAVDAWFLLGLLEFRFASPLGVPITIAKLSFRQAVNRDPTFAAAIGQLAQIAILEDDQTAAQRYMAQYLSLDSTSIWADLVRVADTLLYRPLQAAAVLATFPSRSTPVLENLALLAGELRSPPGGRPIGVSAVDALLARAAPGDERAVAFRMRLATYLGAGQRERARRFLNDGRRLGVPQDELDRWIVLSAITPLEPLADETTARAAANRLLSDTTGQALVSRWLATRWYKQNSPDDAGAAAQGFREAFSDAASPSPLARSLEDDLEAVDLLAAGDTSGALVAWRLATARYSIEDVLFGFVSSLWPLRLDRASVALAAGHYEEVLAATATFGRMAGFTDQVAWTDALLNQAAAALATGDTALAINSYADLLRLLSDAGGSAVTLRDSIAEVTAVLRR
jgi:serine/threonine protein kinase/tetratricopeptide (TPR) repeat protein